MTVNSKRTEWDRENMRTVSCRLRKEDAERFKQYAQYLGTTPHALLAEYVKKCLELEETVTPQMRDNSAEIRNENKMLKKKLNLAMLEVDAARRRATHAEEIVDEYLRS